MKRPGNNELSHLANLYKTPFFHAKVKRQNYRLNKTRSKNALKHYQNFQYIWNKYITGFIKMKQLL